MVNDQGGIHGRKINFITLDDAYSPPKTVEQVRKLVEREKVFALFQTLGTPTNSAIHEYMNKKQVPHLFVATGATKWGDPKHFPWTMGWQPSYQTEGAIYANYLLKNKPDAKVAILYQNDDYGKDYVFGFKQALGDRAEAMIVAEQTYEVLDPKVDSQIVNLKASGADVFFNVSIPKFAAQAIRKIHDLGWKPLHLLNSVSASVGSVLEPAGLEKSQGIVTTLYLIDPTDPSWDNHPDYKEWLAFMEKYYPEGDRKSPFNVYAYAVAATLTKVLEQCGKDLSRENLMKQAANLKDLRVPMLLPGILINTGPDDFRPVEQMQMARFEGDRYVRFGEIISGN
jgi:branched-chain amino acid transport system substrate-binding protein